MGTYPKPKHPTFRKIPRAELLKHIRRYIKETKSESTRLNAVAELGSAGHIPLYDMAPESKVLVVGAREHDADVVHAYAEAFREIASQVDVLFVDLGKLGSPEDVALYEATSLTPGEDNPIYSRYCNLATAATINQLSKSEGYNMVIGGTGPPPQSSQVRWVRMMHVYNEEIASGQLSFPLELRLAIDRKVWSQLQSLEHCRFTDPEGTDFTWTNYDDGRRMTISHEFAKPMNIGRGGQPDCTGVIAGTINHLGAFPHIRVHLKDDLVVKVEGGGKFGDAWRSKMVELNTIQLPPIPQRSKPGSQYSFPGQGFFWFYEMAIGTSPRAFRHPKESAGGCFANFLHERERAGYVHHGFGAPANSQVVFSKAGIPWTHVHVHSLFGTLEGETRNGARTRVIDRGHLTALDDSAVRRVAAKYGRPDKLLEEVWTPAIPGINTKGDYMRDYGANPMRWIMNENSRRRPRPAA